MARVCFIGDEVTAAGYRLAGAATLTPEPGQIPDALERALEASELVLLSQACARLVPAARLERLLRSSSPLLLIVPDAVGGPAPPALAARVRRSLGIQA